MGLQQYTGNCNDDIPLKLTAAGDKPFFEEMDIFLKLDRLMPTATGVDGIPAWFLRLMAPFLALPIAGLFNLSIRNSIVPNQWKAACIIPVPKIANPAKASDFRPISIVPVLSRIMERMIVRKFIYPSLDCLPHPLSVMDQHAFRPSGSTTSAIISVISDISAMLRENSYVRVLALDFSKAFDTLRHSSLMNKYALLSLPDEVYNWLANYFQGRTHCTRVGGEFSTFRKISAGVIQGSVPGPASYVVAASDLAPRYQANKMEKYADDTYLIIPSSSASTTDEELSHIGNWASCNNLRLNNAKSNEVIFTRPRRGRAGDRADPPPPVQGITRVSQLSILEVEISNNLSVSMHVDNLIKSCAQSLYALRTLRAHGLPDGPLHKIFASTTLAKIMYASSAWSGFASAEDKNRLDAFSRKSKRLGYCDPGAPSVSELMAKYDAHLFKNVKCNPRHVLYRALPPLKNSTYNLRKRSHSFCIPSSDGPDFKKNFISRMLLVGAY